MTRVLILGCTGSIGVQALDVIDACDDLELAGLACGTRSAEMRAEAVRRGVRHTCAADGGGSVPHTPDLATLIDETAPDVVLNAIVGSAGLRPTVAALERGVRVALANKETLVAGGEVVSRVRARTGAGLVPVDSEHSALFQLLEGRDAATVRRIVLTASGGPFRGRDRASLSGVGPADALRHPTWDMGAKITIDSATLMNKGLEVIEAHHLFGAAYDDIEVVVHPQSTVHGLVRLVDGSVLAHMGPPDMRVPIGYALRHPAPPPPRDPVELVGMGLTFEAPDTAAFRCLDLAVAAGRAGGLAPAVLNAANEVAVARFLAGDIGFLDIADVVERALEDVPDGPGDELEAVMAADAAGRERAAAPAGGVRA
ncbi:MAG: 1-deoxy-D-xylulose-5-phosphate reductoisomerase [Thermoleophilia bacterium]|nr:1-deoxy-D-xylulose-5-phosphate reductoisomerase [Thermoleophilia bacterium]